MSSEDRESREHAGKCACGKKVFLSPESLRCALQDIQGRTPVETPEPEQEPEVMMGVVGRQPAAPAILLTDDWVRRRAGCGGGTAREPSFHEHVSMS